MYAPDHEIVKAVREGSRRRFADLVDRYKNRAMALAVRILKNREDAEEAVQDAFVRAYNGLDKFQGGSKFGTWFYRILYNVCLTRVGKRKEDYRVLDESEQEEIEDVGGPGPHELLELRDLADRLKQIIAGLPHRYSSVLSLFYFQELSYEEITEVTGIPLGTVKAHLFRARSMLQKRLMTQLQEEGKDEISIERR